MTSLLHAAPPVHSKLESIPGDCPSFARNRKVCYQIHPDRLDRWCEACRDEYLDALAAGDDWMAGMEDGRMVSGFGHSAESISLIARLRPEIQVRTWGPVALAIHQPPTEPEDLADWLDMQAAHYRVGGNGASELVAALLEREAREVRVMEARTAQEYQARCEVMALESQLALADDERFDF